VGLSFVHKFDFRIFTVVVIQKFISCEHGLSSSKINIGGK